MHDESIITRTSHPSALWLLRLRAVSKRQASSERALLYRSTLNTLLSPSTRGCVGGARDHFLAWRIQIRSNDSPSAYLYTARQASALSADPGTFSVLQTPSLTEVGR